EEHESAVYTKNVVEHVMVVHPHDEDGDEARDQREERRPRLFQTVEQRKATRRGIPQVQHEQRDGEREDAIAEGLHPRGFLFLKTFALHDWTWAAGSRFVLP